MKLLIDSSTIIFNTDCPHSNSRIIMDLIIDGQLEGVISERAITEVKIVLLPRRGSRFVHMLEQSLRGKFVVVPLGNVEKAMHKWHGKIKEKDLAHLATAKALGLKFIVAFDRDFEKFPEYYTPKAFVEKILKLRGFETEY